MGPINKTRYSRRACAVKMFISIFCLSLRVIHGNTRISSLKSKVTTQGKTLILIKAFSALIYHSYDALVFMTLGTLALIPYFMLIKQKQILYSEFLLCLHLFTHDCMSTYDKNVHKLLSSMYIYRTITSKSSNWYKWILESRLCYHVWMVQHLILYYLICLIWFISSIGFICRLKTTTTEKD